MSLWSNILTVFKKKVHFSFEKLGHLKDAEFVSKLGDGAHGTVSLYKCAEKHNKKKCELQFVVKEILQTTPDNLYFIKNEFMISSNVNHRYIRSAFDTNEPFFTQIVFDASSSTTIDLWEFVTYKSIETHCKLLMKFHYQLLDALGYLHDNGIAHMDVKLENILIDTHTNQIKLIDFGHSLNFKESSKLPNAHGTELYLPPEVFRNPSRYIPQLIDVWSSAMCLYATVYNAIPWERANRRDAYYVGCKVWFDQFELPVDLFRRIKCFSDTEWEILSTVFLKSFQDDPKSRWSIKQIKACFSELFPDEFEEPLDYRESEYESFKELDESKFDLT